MSLIRVIGSLVRNAFKPASVQYPLPVDGDSVYDKDIWVDESDIGDFSGEIVDLFNNLHSIISNATATDPKIITIHFNRTIVSNAIGIGSVSGDFSNTKIEILNSGDVWTTVIDESADGTKETSKTFQLSVTPGFNGIRLSFATPDTVTLSNCVIIKSTGVVARLQATKPDNTVVDINATTGGNLKTSIEETDPAAAFKFYDESDVAYGIKQIDNKPRVSAMPYLYDIAEGNVPNHEAVRRFGHNPNVGTSIETVYHPSDLKTYLTAAEQLQVTSDNVNDDGSPVGTGALTLKIEGLDANYLEIEETVTMDGTTNVTTIASFLRVATTSVVTAGTTGYNEGTITISNNADTVVLDQIEPIENESHCACYTVPADHTFYVVQAMATEASSKGSEFGLWLRTFGGIWTAKRNIVLLDSNIILPMLVPMKIPAKSDIEIRATAILAGAIVTAGIDGWIEHD